jgi:hypothetical protein
LEKLVDLLTTVIPPPIFFLPDVFSFASRDEGGLNPFLGPIPTALLLRPYGVFELFTIDCALAEELEAFLWRLD